MERNSPALRIEALVKLEQAGMLTLLATQNFDALHEKAGNSDNVIVNLHGTIGTSHCMKCHQEYATADIMARLMKSPDPHCHRKLKYRGDMPVAMALSKPMWCISSEALPDGAMEKSLQSGHQSRRTMGNRIAPLRVYPAASIVPVAAQAGVPITIMNMGRHAI